MRKTLVAALVCSASVVGVGAGSAFAGEINGIGKGTPIVSHEGPLVQVNDVQVIPSECAFSGLADEYGANAPGHHPQTPGGTTASGDEARAFTAVLCKGSGGGRVKP